MCMSWTYFHKHDRANWIYVTKHEEIFFSWNIFHTSGNTYASMWFLAWIVTYIQLAVLCLWNEVQNIRKRMQKSTKSWKSSLCHLPEFLRTKMLGQLESNLVCTQLETKACFDPTTHLPGQQLPLRLYKSKPPLDTHPLLRHTPAWS